MWSDGVVVYGSVVRWEGVEGGVPAGYLEGNASDPLRESASLDPKTAESIVRNRPLYPAASARRTSCEQYD